MASYFKLTFHSCWKVETIKRTFQVDFDSFATLECTKHCAKITDSLFAALFLGILFLIIQLTPKVRLGSGDIKLAILIGMLLGFYWSFIALLAVSILLSLYSIIMVLNKGKIQAYSEVYPLAPFWLLGSIFAVIFGNIISSYLGIVLIR